VNALVIDDEAPARRRLSRMLETLTGVRVLAQLEDVSGLVEALRNQPVDVLFLDVCMPGMDGMTLAQSRHELPPIVFVTAHHEYAAQAFAVDAVDYLLKPVRPERLVAAVERVCKRAASASPRASGSAPPPIAAPSAPRIIVNTRHLIQLFDARTITRFWSSDKYTLFLAGGEEHLTEEPLTALAERLSAFGFLRVHRAELVRGDAVSALRIIDGRYEVCLSDGQSARVSRRALPAIKLALGLG
jgi:DNA-binding LytR/AlgR family response regulator